MDNTPDFCRFPVIGRVVPVTGRFPVPGKVHSMVVRLLPSLRPAALLGLVILLAGCATGHPLEIADADWERMSTEQRAEAYRKQADLDALEAERRAEEARAAREAQRRHRERLEQRRLNARFGDMLQCVLEDARVDLWGDWVDAEPLAFTLVRGETRAVALRDEKGRREIEAWTAFDRQGQTVSVCRHRYRDGRLDHCLRMVGTFRDFSDGMARFLDGEDFLRGRLRCAFGPGTDAPGYPPPRHPRH